MEESAKLPGGLTSGQGCYFVLDTVELHLLNALTEVAEGLDVDVDPAGIVLGVLGVDAFADAEADDIAVLGILEGCAVVEASGDHGIGCGKT